MWSLEPRLLAERHRIVRLCARLTGQPDAAEDLAQETFLEAWRHAQKLRDESGFPQWLSAIARNVCLRWAHNRGKELTRLSVPQADSPTAETLVPDDLDLEVDLERHELALLLDRAMSLLPSDSRRVLVARCIEDLPQAEVAARLGLSEGAVAVRLHRGKLALRRVLSTDMREEAREFGLGTVAADRWEDTGICCPICGSHKLVGRLNLETGEMLLKCPGCTPAPAMHITQTILPDMKGVRGYRSAVTRMIECGREYYAEGLRNRVVPCPVCRQSLPLRTSQHEVQFAPGLRYYFSTECPRCNTSSTTALASLAFCLPEGQTFWKRHKRLRTLPEREVEANGRPALVVGMESLTCSASFHMICARDTFEVIEIYR